MKKRGRRRKKGRPSLLDLQKRALRLQQDSDANPSPTAIAGTLRRSVRRSSFHVSRVDEDDGYEGEGSCGRRRKEKPLQQLVLGSPLEDLPGVSWEEPSGWGGAGSKSDGEKNRGIDGCDVGGNGSGKGEPELPNSFRGARSISQGEPSDPGPRTPLPDKNLLMLTLDRLQKKDKYKVYSEPVDPNELPDYHEIIDNPMDFSTVRKKLSDDAYSYLEDFEKDILLISSNAMTYNAPSTIYFRQARSIEELAKKCFENIRQGGNDDDLEHKLVRRGRPPGKISSKKPIGRPPTKHMLGFSNAVLGNTSRNYLRSIPSNASMENGLASNQPIATSLCYQNLHSSENLGWLGSQTPLRMEQLSGEGNKAATLEENDMNAHDWSMTQYLHGPHILNAVEGEKQLIPSRLAFVLHMHMQEVLLDLLLILVLLVGKLLPSGLKRLCHRGQGLALDGLGRRHLNQTSNSFPVHLPLPSFPRKLIHHMEH